MRSPRGQFAGVVFVVAIGVGARTGEAQLWKQFVPKSKAAASDEPRAAQLSADAQAIREERGRNAAANLQPAAGGQAAPVGGDLALTQDNGPWLIVASSFSGDGAEGQARALAEELRNKFRMAAYVHEMSFKFGDDNPGQGLDNYGAPTKRHYRRGDRASEIAVLVGNFPSIEDPEGQQMLARIKSLEPDALNVDADQTAQSMAKVRQLEEALKEKLGSKSKKRGPMGQAFFTRNPMLPREYFVPKGVDTFVAKMNEGVEHSLLDCPGQKSIQVATFRGKTILQTSAQEPASKSFFGSKKHEDRNPLVEAAENAHLLTKELRDHGWEAYEFHDRTESIVTIGSFAEVTQKLPNGQVVVIPQVQKIYQTFDAGFDTPADPLSGIGNDEMTRQRVEQQEQQVGMQLSGKQAQIVPGLNPKHVKILHGRGKSVKVDRIIPMDVHPQAIDVPKRSLSSAYAG
jgi:hypothetical protein